MTAAPGGTGSKRAKASGGGLGTSRGRGKATTLRAPERRALLELTGLPTAAGREDRVIAWIERWAKRRRQVELKRDEFGNMLLQRVGARGQKPIVFTAHLDHPAFVVNLLAGPQVGAEFRGGVEERYFQGASVVLHHGDGPAQRGRIVSVQNRRAKDEDRRVVVRFDAPPTASIADVLTWDLPEPQVRDGHLHAPAVDDLAGVAAALAAFDRLLKSRRKRPADVRVLLTRAEEVGFVGAIAACRSGLIPAQARLVALEMSRSFAESPIGAGPIVRVGDRTSTFDPGLTYDVARIAQSLADRDPAFRWQRRLMPGGTCEATAYQTYGFTSTCLCLPLGNYHNMNEHTQRVAPEVISIKDYAHLVALLVEVGRGLENQQRKAALRTRLDRLFDQRRALLSRDENREDAKGAKGAKHAKHAKG